MLGGGRLWVEIICGVFLLARLLHAFGLSKQNPTNSSASPACILTALAGVTVGIRLIWLARFTTDGLKRLAIYASTSACSG